MAKPRGDVIKYALVDAFADSTFKGNPAAVCVLEEERSEEWMQAVAREFNISATCFLIRVDENVARFNLRWFTPVAELKICGHATLAASHFCFTTGLASGDVIEFSTLSGILTAKRVQGINKSDSGKHENGLSQQLLVIELDFPTIPLADYNSFETFSISKALGGAPVIDVKRTTTDDDLFVVLASAVKHVQPQTEDIRQCSGRGIIISGQAPPESGFDFFSRFFCPKLGIIEDPVCGSAHCAFGTILVEKAEQGEFCGLCGISSERDCEIALR